MVHELRQDIACSNNWLSKIRAKTFHCGVVQAVKVKAASHIGVRDRVATYSFSPGCAPYE
uniref:Uncharacterized protein n=1 Tax=Rhizophora mucronata TaxID=61149 RepID=A0A2P2NIJ6_RHIMU